MQLTLRVLFIPRYHTVGPQQTLYIPGPLILEGTNEVQQFRFNLEPFTKKSDNFLLQIIIFEKYLGGTIAAFTNEPNLG